MFDYELDKPKEECGVFGILDHTGETTVKNAQPIVINYFKGTLALVHNGNLTNIDELKGTLQENGAIFHSTTDSEIITYQIALERTKCPDIETAVFNTAEKLKGGFALIIMNPQKLIGVRDSGLTAAMGYAKKAGAKEVHVRISSPPFLHPCFYGTDVPSNHQLIASSCTTKEICSRIGADSLGYLQIEDFSKMVGDLPICRACFDGKYPL